MRARGWVVAAMLMWCGVAGAQPKLKDPKPQAIDIKELRDRLLVFQDPSGGTYAVLGEKGQEPTRIWYGPGKTLFEQVQPRRSRNGDQWSISVWAPRVEQFRPGWVARKEDGSFEKSCGHADEAVLTELTGDKRKAVLDSVSFVTTGIIRVPHWLARDDRGVYYYVDRLNKVYGGKGFRVLVGRKGALKEFALVDVAADSSGEVYSTKAGDLRLVKFETPGTAPTARWIKGKKTIDLVLVDIISSERMIFRELGVYKALGTFCDNL